MIRRFGLAGYRTVLAVTGAAALVAAGSAIATGAVTLGSGSSAAGLTNAKIVLPDNQAITSYGHRTELTGGTVGTAISPDGSTLAVQSGGYSPQDPSLHILSAATGQVLQSFGPPGVSAPVYSPDGTVLYAASQNSTSSGGPGTGLIWKYTVGADGLVTDPTTPQVLSLSSGDFPFDLAISADGSTLYAVLNGNNDLGVIDTATMKLTARIPVGVAPQAVAIVGNEAFVANRGGRRAVAGDSTNASGGNNEDGNGPPGTQTVDDPTTEATTTGTVSVVDLTTNQVTATISVGLQPNSLTVHDGSVLVTNSNSSTVSIIDAATNEVTDTFTVEPLAGTTAGVSPNSITFTDDSHLLVSVGGANAIAEYTYNGPATDPTSQGLIPTDWYPDQVSYDAADGMVIVSNAEGVSTDGAPSVYDTHGTVTEFAPPPSATLATLTSAVLADNGWNDLPASNSPGTGTRTLPDGELPAIPAHLGQPSAIKHVFLIIRGNQTYDQILGDIGKGNSDPQDTQFGEQVTPNLHKLASTYSLFDNFYDAGEVAEDGDNWIVQGDNNDYLQQQAATAMSRTGNYATEDPLSVQQTGFLWNDVEAAGGTVANYGELENLVNGRPDIDILGPPTWGEYYGDAEVLEGKASGPLPISLTANSFGTNIASLSAISNPEYPDLQMAIPDQFRVDVWEQDFRQAEQTGNLPSLTIMQLPEGQTGGAGSAAAAAADNDLAIGRVISDISHSQFWGSSAIFVVSDDTQAGTDHVDPHRAPLFIASPYARRGVINDDHYSQVNVVKTIEQILGAQPMNLADRAASPMFDAFTNTPDTQPYTVVPNKTSLTQSEAVVLPVTP